MYYINKFAEDKEYFYKMLNSELRAKDLTKEDIDNIFNGIAVKSKGEPFNEYQIVKGD